MHDMQVVFVLQENIDFNQAIHIVLGNESCDLDSFTSAAVHAWHQTKVDKLLIMLGLSLFVNCTFSVKISRTTLFKVFYFEPVLQTTAWLH